MRRIRAAGAPRPLRLDDLDLLLLRLLDRPQRRVARLVDARLDRQDGRGLDLADVDEPAFELALEDGLAGAVPLDLLHDRDAREPE